MPEMKLYENPADFAEVYPFVPYQFNLLGKVLDAVRLFSSPGKNSSYGERSMLSMYLSTAKSVQNEDEGILVRLMRFIRDCPLWWTMRQPSLSQMHSAITS